jgi:hypothetical protein
LVQNTHKNTHILEKGLRLTVYLPRRPGPVMPGPASIMITNADVIEIGKGARTRQTSCVPKAATGATLVQARDAV